MQLKFSLYISIEISIWLIGWVSASLRVSGIERNTQTLPFAHSNASLKKMLQSQKTILRFFKGDG